MAGQFHDHASGLQLQIELLAYADGFLDINARLTNVSADPKIKSYAAVVCRWGATTDRGFRHALL